TRETNAAELARLMVGRDVLLRVEKTEANPREVTLSVKNLRQGAKLNAVSFGVRAGEMVGVAGVGGNRQTRLIGVLAGVGRADEGAAMCGGRDLSKLSARTVKEMGVAHIPEDRHLRGLLLEFNLADNSILGSQCNKPPSGALGLIDEKAVVSKAARLIRDFD